MSESRSVKSSKNIISGFALKTFTMLLAFVSKTVFIKVFGVEMLGINGLFSNVISILCLADLGFSTAMTYSYYKPIAENDCKKIAQLNHFYRKVYNYIALCIAVIGLLFIPFLKYIINLEKEIDHLYLYYLLTLVSTVVSYLFVYKTTVLHAYQQSYLVTKYNMIISTASTVAQIIFMLLVKNYILYLCISIFFGLLNNIVVSHISDKQYPFINDKVSPLAKEDRKGIFANLGSVFLYKISSVLMNSTDNIIISKIIGTIAVGYYSNYLTVINLIQGYVSITFTSLTASVGNMMAKDSEEKQYHIFKNVQAISAWMSIVISSCVYVLIDKFIVIWLGQDFVLDRLTVIAIAVNFFLVCILNPIWIFREAAGIYRKTKYIMVVCAVINVVLSIVMGKLMDVSGVLFASAISKLLTYIWYEPIILFRDFFKISPIKFFVPTIGITALSAVCTCILYYITNMIILDGIVGFIVNGVVCFIASNIFFFIIFFRNKYLRDVMKRILNLAKSVIKR